jgi:hypothetical protein
MLEKNLSRLAMFSPVCLKLAGHWKRITRAFNAFAQDKVSAQASCTMQVDLKYPAPFLSSSVRFFFKRL